MTGSGRDETGADWSSGDWGGVSDEQYWAELSADKPLATTARSAPAGGNAYPEAATGYAEADADPADAGGRRARRDPASARSSQEQASTMAAAGASTAQFSLPSASGRQGRLADGPANPPVPPESPAFADPAADAEPATSPQPRAYPMSTGSVDTDPSIGMGGWQDAAGGDEPAGRDSRAWAEDPLTSPSFSPPGSYSADSRSYRGSHTRGRGCPDEPAGGPGSSSYGPGHDYQTVPAWEDSYGSRPDDGWRASGHDYPGGRLDPLPESAGSAAWPDGGWYSAPRSPGAGGTASYREPSHESWERRETGYDDASRHDPYTEPGRRNWPDQHESARYDQSGYDAAHGRDPGSSGYYGDTGYDPADGGYGQPDHRHDGSGYGEPGYGEPGYGGSEAGYRPSKHGSPDMGYDLPDYGRGYQQPGDDAPDADYGLPAYGSGGSHGSFGQGSGRRRYPGYDAGRR